MTFIALVAKNLARQRIRTLLTVLGIAVGITTVVALSVLTVSAKATTEQILKAGGADFMVGQKGAADLTFSTVPVEEWQEIEALPEVEWAHGALLQISRVGSNPLFVTIGMRPGDLAESPPQLVSGRLLAGPADEIVLGADGARNLDVGVGDTVTIDTHAFRVVGTYRSGNTWEDNGAYAPLETVQDLARKQDVVTAVYVKVVEGEDPDAVAQAIRDTFSGLTTVSSVDEVSEVDQGAQVIDALNLAVSLLAVGIGAIGVMNTMVMSVFERTREIGILRAVGWGGGRITRMIVGESLVLCGISAVFGMGLGVLAIRGIALIPQVRSFLAIEYTADPFVRALVVAVVVSLLGAVYPVVRAVRLTPMEALRHE